MEIEAGIVQWSISDSSRAPGWSLSGFGDGIRYS